MFDLVIPFSRDYIHNTAQPLDLTALLTVVNSVTPLHCMIGLYLVTFNPVSPSCAIWTHSKA